MQDAGGRGDPPAHRQERLAHNAQKTTQLKKHQRNDDTGVFSVEKRRREVLPRAAASPPRTLANLRTPSKKASSLVATENDVAAADVAARPQANPG